MYLRVFLLSDICEGSSNHVLSQFWDKPRPAESPFLWPNSPLPSAADWQCWRNTLHQILHLGRQLQLGKPLGHWNYSATGWFFDPETVSLWHVMTQGATHHGQIPKRGRICWFHVLDHPKENPPLTHWATIIQEGNHLRLTGYGSITKVMKATGNPIEYLRTLTFNQEWSLELQVVGNLDVLLEQVVGGNRLGVSDGLYRKGSGTAAWIVEGTTADHCMLGQICTPGVDTDHSSFRSELAGIYSLLFTLWYLTRGQPKQRFRLACDGKSVLSKLQHLSYTEPTEAHADLLSATRWLLQHWGGG